MKSNVRPPNLSFDSVDDSGGPMMFSAALATPFMSRSAMQIA